jgi:hypothetical protein
MKEGLQFSFSEARGNTYICVELANEAGEVTVLEVARKKDVGEFVRVPNDEAVASSTPRNNRVRQWVFHHFKGLGKKRRRTHLVQPLHRLRREAGRGGGWSPNACHRLLLFNSHSLHIQMLETEQKTHEFETVW